MLVKEETVVRRPVTASSATLVAVLAEDEATPETAESNVLAMVVASDRLRLVDLEAVLPARDATVVATDGTSTEKS